LSLDRRRRTKDETQPGRRFEDPAGTALSERAPTLSTSDLFAHRKRASNGLFGHHVLLFRWETDRATSSRLEVKYDPDVGARDDLLTIGEVAARAGVRTSTLRYYEDEGLLRPARRIGGQRRYDAGAIEALTVVRFCRTLGFSLTEIRTLLTEPRGTRKRTQW